MNGVDYTKQLGKAKEDYQSNLDRTNKSHKLEVERMKEQHEAIEKNQASNLEKSRSNLEKSFQDRVETIDDTTKRSLEDKSKVYVSKIDQERQRLTEDKELASTQYRKNLEDITKNYKQNIDAKDSMNAEKMEFAKENFVNNSQKQQRIFENNIDSMAKTSTDSVAKTKNAYNEKMQDVNTKHSESYNALQADSNKKLGALRENFQNSIAAKDSTQAQRLAELSNNNSDQKSSQSNSFNNARKDLLKKNEEMVKQTNLDSKKALEETKRDFVNKIEQVKHGFADVDRAKTMKHNETLGRMRDGFDQGISNERAIRLDKEKFDNDSYKERLGSITKDYNGNVDDLRNRTIGEGSSLSKDFQKSKEMLVRKRNKEMQDTIQAETKKSNMLKSKINEDVDKLRKTQIYELNASRSNNQKNFEAMKKSQDAQVGKAFGRFAEMNEDLVKKTSENNSKLNRELANRVSDLNSEHTKDLKDQHARLTRTTSSGDAYAKIREEQEQNSMKKQYDQKIAQYKNEVSGVERDFIENNKIMAKTFEADLQKKTDQYGSELDGVKNQATIERLNDQISSKKEISTMERSFEERSRLEDQDHQVEQSSQSRKSADKIQKLSDNFNRTMKDVNFKNELHVQELREDLSRDKKTFVENISKQTEDDKFKMRKDFDIKLNKVVTGYERELDKVRVDNASLRRTMDSEIDLARQKANQMVASEREIMGKKSFEDMKMAKAEKERRERELITQIDALHVNYGKKLNEQNYQANLKLDTLARDYGYKMDSLKKEVAGQIKVKDNQLLTESQRLKSAFEGEKTRLVQQYENQIQSLNDSHQQQIASLGEYKKAESQNS